ncbi:RNA-directed DNA polymerase-like protein [Cucumis melo var. makuwa]|uniref:RNA-directed DNA polymerase-like protein n=1 Tax=Cucumis melo var. makuwa TaxID=1194695 RepID=A0A5D3CSW5_CUCMM|nr:RNA-directed DNA polymerase-like protein [Cucumis melo var. makuwa]
MINDYEIVALIKATSDVFKNGVPEKMIDPRSFTVSCLVDDMDLGHALCDQGASINLMPLSIFKKLRIGDGNNKPSVEVLPKLELKSEGVIDYVKMPQEGDRIDPVTGWRICIDYCKLNAATKKEMFLLFGWHSGYNQITIALKDQHKTTFTCPYGTFAFRRMPFDLCNASRTFQKECLNILEELLKRCEETRLILNWEKCHFMVTVGSVLGHKIAHVELEVDPTKIDVVSKLPLPSNLKPLRSFLEYAGFYSRFIKSYS